MIILLFCFLFPNLFILVIYIDDSNASIYDHDTRPNAISGRINW